MSFMRNPGGRIHNRVPEMRGNVPKDSCANRERENLPTVRFPQSQACQAVQDVCHKARRFERLVEFYINPLPIPALRIDPHES